MIRSIRRSVCCLGVATVAVLSSVSASHAAFTINLNFTGNFSTSQLAAFNNAKATWESLIPAYQPGITLTTLNINANRGTDDGAGGTLAYAGWTRAEYQAASSGTVYALATDGIMFFDDADIDSLEAAGNFGDVIVHEMAHVMGFGTLWTYNGVYVNGTGRYTGANALNAYRFEFSQPGAAYVPVDLSGRQGTQDGHWAELNNVFDPQGRTLSSELMTGYLDTSTPYISQTTIQSFRDIGFAPVPLVVPEPATIGLMMLGVVSLGVVQVRRRKLKK